MNTRKCIVLLIIIAILSITFNVQAATGDSYKIGLSASKTTLKAGETVTISLKVSDIKIQSGEKGIGSYEGSIVYDANVFEDVKMKGNDLWDTPTLNQGRFTSVRSDGMCVSEAQEIATITLKVKENATAGNTKIQIKNFEASNAKENISTADTEVTVKVEGTTSNVNNTITGETNTTNTTNKITGGTNTNKINSGSTTQSRLPKAGISSTIIVFIVIGAVAGIYTYIRYKKIY